MCIPELETPQPCQYYHAVKKSSNSIKHVIINLSRDICFSKFNSKMLLRCNNLLLALMLNLVDSNYEDAEIESITSPENCIKLIEIQLLKNSIVMFTIRILIEIFRIFHLYSDRNFQNLNFLISPALISWQKIGFKTQWVDFNMWTSSSPKISTKIRNFIDYRL